MPHRFTKVIRKKTKIITNNILNNTIIVITIYSSGLKQKDFKPCTCQI